MIPWWPLLSSIACCITARSSPSAATATVCARSAAPVSSRRRSCTRSRSHEAGLPSWVHKETRAAASDSCGHSAARVPVDYLDKPSRPWRQNHTHRGGQFFMSPGGYFRMSLDTPSQGWRTFLRNHAPDVAAMDLFVISTIGFKLLYAFVIVRLDRRELVCINVTAHPTAEWVAR